MGEPNARATSRTPLPRSHWRPASHSMSVPEPPTPLSYQVLADPTGRRRRRLAVAGRVATAALTLWLAALTLGGLGLQPLAGLPVVGGIGAGESTPPALPQRVRTAVARHATVAPATASQTVAAPPGQTETSPSTAVPGRTKTSPSTTVPGRTKTSPSTTAPGRTKTSPSTTAPGRTRTSPSTTAPRAKRNSTALLPPVP